jgi:energy-coupling factor transport system ATP-binding protein
MSEPMVRLSDARYVYPHGGVIAVDGLSLDIGASEIVGVIGQNGSGKTTFTKLLNGLLRPTAGRVIVDGRDTADHTVQAMASSVGYVFQNPNHQLFARTVRAELEFGPRNIGCRADEIEARVSQAVELFGLADILGSHPYRISLPLRKLVGIASVFTMGPRVYVFDEPTTGQDHRTSSVIERLIRDLGERGVTVVCVSHDMALIGRIAKRALLMHDGRLIADGPPREVFADGSAMDRGHLVPPQITRLSMRLPGRGGRPAALTVDELVADLGVARRARPGVRSNPEMS